MFSRSEPVPAVRKPPLFPTFLLPSLPIPFRRRDPKASSSPPRPASPPDFQLHPFSSTSTSPPSLCTSPLSTTSSTPSSPTSPISYFPNLSYAPSGPSSLTTTTTSRSPPRQQQQQPQAALARPLPDTLRCSTCAADLAFAAQIVSKGFTGRHGRGYLVAPPPAAAGLANVRVGPPENRLLVTGSHVVADISCRLCGTKVGWKYEDAKEPAQQYKIGKFILETARVVASRTWEDGPVGGGGGSGGDAPAGRARGSVDASWFAAGGEGAAAPAARGDDDGGEVMFDSDNEDECEDIFAGIWDADLVAKRRKSRVAALAKKQ